MTDKNDYYSDAMNKRRDEFNNIINGIDMVLINNIPEVDSSIWENWQDKTPLAACEIVDGECDYHGIKINDYEECDYQDDTPEVYQWFAVNPNDADYLKSRDQYITYSDKLDIYILAICHFGTSWDYVDSMVDAILGDK